MRLFTVKQIKDTHHILTFNQSIFNKLTQLNPNLYFCVFKLLKNITQSHAYKKLYLNYKQVEQLSNKSVYNLNVSNKAMIHFNENNSIAIYLYQMLMEGFSLSLLLKLESKQITMATVETLVNQLNEMYLKLCELSIPYDVKIPQYFIATKTSHNKREQKIHLTEKGKQLLTEAPIELISVLREMFATKYSCYLTVSLSSETIEFLDNKLVNLDITQLSNEEQWKYEIFRHSVQSLTPEFYDIELYVWHQIANIIFNPK